MDAASSAIPRAFMSWIHLEPVPAISMTPVSIAADVSDAMPEL